MDNSELAKRVKSAAVAGWWTILIAGVFMTVHWFVFMVILHCKPAWLLWLWGGGDLDWPQVRNIVLYYYATFKLILLTVMVIVIWLTLWSRRLKRLG